MMMKKKIIQSIIFYRNCVAMINIFAMLSQKELINSDLELDDAPQSWTLRSLATVM